jgi:hypothetical protein
MSEERVTGKNGHVYPSGYVPPTGNVFIDEAWEILDMIPPGTLAPELRFLLAGIIAGTISRHSKE